MTITAQRSHQILGKRTVDGTKSRGKSSSLDFLFLRTAHPSKYKFSIQKCVLSMLKEHFGLNCKYKSFYLMENGVLQCMSFFHFSYQSHTCTSMLSTNMVRECQILRLKEKLLDMYQYFKKSKCSTNLTIRKNKHNLSILTCEHAPLKIPALSPFGHSKLQWTYRHIGFACKLQLKRTIINHVKDSNF